MDLKETKELRCPHCMSDNPLMFTFSNRVRDRVNVHCEVCSKDFIQKFVVSAEKFPLPTDKENKK